MKEKEDIEIEFRGNVCKSLKALLKDIEKDRLSSEDIALCFAVFSCQIVMTTQGLTNKSRKYMQDMMKDVWSEVAIKYKDFHGLE